MRSQQIAGIAALVVSMALFATALLGIASIDPSAGAAAPSAPPRSISLQDDGRDPDCPLRERPGRDERKAVSS